MRHSPPSTRRWRKGGIDDVDAYLKRAIVNTVKGGWRRRFTERKYADEFERDAVEVSHGRAFEPALVQRDEVWTALRRLPAGQRRVVVLRYYEDMSEAGAAQALGISAGTVKSQASKGLAALQAMLQEEVR